MQYGAPILNFTHQEKTAMHSTLKLIALLLIAVPALAQQVDTTAYLSVTFTQKNAFKLNRVYMVVSDGRDPEKFIGSTYIVKDEKSEILVFDGIVGGFNYLAGRGYRFVDAIPVTSAGQTVYNYLFERVKK